MTFSFGFQIDEADLDEDAEFSQESSKAEHAQKEDDEVVRLPPKKHTTEELLDNLPSSISFTTISVKRNNRENLHIRELFDARYQTALCDEEFLDNSEDLKAGVYEGGFKTWECALDLCSVLPNFKEGKFMEIGCGTAIPSLCLFNDLLKVSDGKEATELILQDYNIEVLNLMTFPNLFLTWFFSKEGAEAPDNELDITPDLKAEFRNDLTTRGISLSFFSGSWKGLETLLPPSINLVITSETIYSMSSLPDLLPLLRGGKVLVAAKVLYFGVGGGVPNLHSELRKSNMAADRIWKGGFNGVGREILEITCG